MSKRISPALLIGLTLLFTLAGCGPAAPERVTDTPPAALAPGPAVARAAAADTPVPPTPPPPAPSPTPGPAGEMLAGQVLWGANPVGGVRVDLRTNGCSPASSPKIVASAVSDAQGRYAFLKPPVGEFALCAVWPDGEESRGATPHAQVAAGQTIAAGPATTLQLARSLTLMEPAEGSEVSLQPALRWQPLPAAASYRVIVANPNTTAVVLDQVVTSAALAVDVPLQPGSRHQWTVLARDANDRVLAVLDSWFETSGVAPVATPDPRGPEAYGMPPSCQPRAYGTGAMLYAEPNGRYCFVYPAGFTLQTEGIGQQNVELAVNGPALDKSPDPLRASMAMEVTSVPEGTVLKQAVDGFLKQFEGMPVPAIRRQDYAMGGGPAELLEGMPGRGGSRDIFALSSGGNRLYHFVFTPSVKDFPQAAANVEELFGIVTSSFAFTYPGPAPVLSGPGRGAAEPAPARTAPAGFSLARYDGVSFFYPSSLAEGVRGETAPAEGSAGGPWWEAVPQRTEIMLDGYPVIGKEQAARIIVYSVADFVKVNDEAANRIRRLQEMVVTRPDRALTELPFLPLINARQQIQVGMQYVDFQRGSGVRFLTQYGQGPAADGDLLYTFQGLTEDARFYVAAILPVPKSLLPDRYRMMSLSEQEAFRSKLEKDLEAGAPGVKPALADLDALVTSIRIDRPVPLP